MSRREVMKCPAVWPAAAAEREGQGSMKSMDYHRFFYFVVRFNTGFKTIHPGMDLIHFSRCTVDLFDFQSTNHKKCKTRMHSSRMRTARSLTVSHCIRKN